MQNLKFRICVKDNRKDHPFTDTKTSAKTMAFFFFFSIITQVLEQAIQLNFASINLQISEKN